MLQLYYTGKYVRGTDLVAVELAATSGDAARGYDVVPLFRAHGAIKHRGLLHVGVLMASCILVDCRRSGTRGC